MEHCIITEKFTLIPKHLYKPEYLGEMFTIAENETVRSIVLEKHDAVLSYASPDNSPEEAVPLAYRLIKAAEMLNEHNKVVVNYLPEKKISHIVAMEGKKLLLANTYRTCDAKTLLYFIELVLQQVMFNPQLTRIHIYGHMKQDETKLVEGYFCGVETIEGHTK